MPCHLVCDMKFDGCHESRLVLNVDPVEVFSGVVSIETIRTAFVMAAGNGLEVCVADVSTLWQNS